MSNFDFAKVSKPQASPNGPDWSDPVSFFYKLSHPEIRDFYPVQRDILRDWYSEFKNGVNDKMVSLNTGGGKTLIGLMIAEAVRRETNGKVLYICPNNFLGKQTFDESRKYGIKVSSYLNLSGADGHPAWEEKNLFLENKAVCVTNYSAVFNARSIFKDFEIKGIIFDDAHLSLDLLDDQYTLRIEDGALTKKIADIFKSSPTVKEKLLSIQEGDPLALVMIPPLEWHNQAATVKDLLAGNDDIKDGLPWLNVKEKFDKTFCFISARKVEISFLYPNIKKHYAFHKTVHRVYLSATLPNLDGIALGFNAFRPESRDDGTLDVCWEDEEKKIVIGFENKVDKTNKTLSKREIDQCSGHNNWLESNYAGYERRLFVVGDIENYHGLGSPLKIYHLKIDEIKKVADKVAQVYAKKIYPEQIDPCLDTGNLRADKIFPLSKVIDLPAVKNYLP